MAMKQAGAVAMTQSVRNSASRGELSVLIFSESPIKGPRDGEDPHFTNRRQFLRFLS